MLIWYVNIWLNSYFDKVNVCFYPMDADVTWEVYLKRVEKEVSTQLRKYDDDDVLKLINYNWSFLPRIELELSWGRLQWFIKKTRT